MSTVFTQNMNSFLERYPNYRSLFTEGLEERMMADLNLQEKDGILELWHKNELVDSTAKGFMPEFSDLKPLTILEGFGLGVNLQSLLAADTGELKEIVVVEPSFERFCFSLQLTNFKQLFENPSVHWLIGFPEALVFSSLFEIFKNPPRCFYVQSAQFIAHPKLSKTHSVYFKNIREEWRSVVAMLKRAYGNKEDSQLGLKNVVQNKDFIEVAPGVDLLTKAFKGVPSVIASAGPSLHASLEDLKVAQNKAIIIAVDAAANVLIKNGITPHFIMSLERIHWTKKFFEPLPKDLRSNFVGYPLVPKEVIESYPGPKWCAYRNQAYFYYIGEQCPKAIITSSSSVSHMALRFADHLGSNLIAIVGQDLSYDPNTLQSHSDGVAFEDWSKSKTVEEVNEHLKSKDRGQLIYIEGLDGEKVPTNSVWFTFLKEFSWEATRVQARVINCTKSGAMIPNLERGHLGELLEDWVSKDDLFEDIELAHASYEPQSISWATAIDYLRDIDNRLGELQEQSANLKSLGADKLDMKEKGLALLRNTIDQLSVDVMTLGFVIEIQASLHWEMENAWHLNSSNNQTDLDKRLSLLEGWFQEMRAAAQESLKILGSSHNQPTAS